MGMSSGGGGGAMSDINVTPLVDVMLVLLIIFMITAPSVGQNEDIELPAEHAAPLKMDEDQLIMRIDRNKQFYLLAAGSNTPNLLTAEEVPVKLAAIAKANPDLPVFLEADGEVPYSQVAFVLAAAQAAGLPRVGMVFDPSRADEGGQ